MNTDPRTETDNGTAAAEHKLVPEAALPEDHKVVTPPSYAAPHEDRLSLRGSIVRAGVAAGLGVTALIFFLAAKGSPEWISGSYKQFSRAAMYVIGSIFSIFPFSVVELLIYAGIIGIAAAMAVTTVHSFKLGQTLRRWLRLCSHLFLAASIMLSMFSGLWGLNYHSSGLANELGLEVRERSSDVLAAALDEIVNELWLVTMNIPCDEDGRVDWGGFHEQSHVARRAWQSLGQSEPFFADTRPLLVKRVTMSYAMSYTGLTGVFIAFTGEASVNAHFPDSGRIFTMCHETAHAMGCAAENDANFAALLACRASSEPLARYSGYLAAFSYCYNALCKVDRDAAYERWYRLPQQAVDDFAERSEYWDRFEGKVQKVATSVNDAYLKAMNQPSGVHSYGEVVDLILAEFVSRTGYVEQANA